MPELPEVETTKNGIAAHIMGQSITRVIIRQSKLRWPIPRNLNSLLSQTHFQNITRRAKYLLLRTSKGTLIIHLGMSGSLHIVSANKTPEKHDHVDIIFNHGKCLRYTDPRRFGAILWTKERPAQHKLLRNLGPEPLSHDFHDEVLFTASRKKQLAIKNFIMDSHIVVGVGNIYANEALFRAGIRPTCKAGMVSKTAYQKLSLCIKDVLKEAIQQGGTTLKDFVHEDGKPGYFKQSLDVYGRGGELCHQCEKVLKEIRLGQRSTVYCSHCQK